jgi:hypothetical protein
MVADFVGMGATGMGTWPAKFRIQLSFDIASQTCMEVRNLFAQAVFLLQRR